MFGLFSESVTSVRPVGRLRSITAMLRAGALVAVTLLVSGMANAEEKTLRATTDFPSIRLNKHEQGDAAVSSTWVVTTLIGWVLLGPAAAAAAAG